MGNKNPETKMQCSTAQIRINNQNLILITHRNRKQYSSYQNQRMFLAYERIGVLKPRTELCKQIIRIQDCVRVCSFVCVYVCVPLTIDYWTQGLKTESKQKQYSTIQFRSESEKLEVNGRTVQSPGWKQKMIEMLQETKISTVQYRSETKLLLDPQTTILQKPKTVQIRPELDITETQLSTAQLRSDQKQSIRIRHFPSTGHK